MTDLDFDLDHLDFDAAENAVEAQQNVQQQQDNSSLYGDDDDECSGGACKI